MKKFNIFLEIILPVFGLIFSVYGLIYNFHTTNSKSKPRSTEEARLLAKETITEADFQALRKFSPSTFGDIKVQSENDMASETAYDLRARVAILEAQLTNKEDGLFDFKTCFLAVIVWLLGGFLSPLRDYFGERFKQNIVQKIAELEVKDPVSNKNEDQKNG